MGDCKVRLLLDPDDDVDVAAALRRRCEPGSGRLCIDVGPGLRSDRALAAAVLDALGNPPIGWMNRVPLQLSLFAGIPAPSPPEQLELWSLQELHADVAASMERFYRPRVALAETAGALADGAIRHLYVLRAHTLPPARWATLCTVARRAELSLWLVVHGCPPTAAQRQALDGYEVRSRVVRRRIPLSPPWWAIPGRPASPVVWRQVAAHLASAVHAGSADGTCRSFLVREPLVSHIRVEDMAAAVRAMLDRNGYIRADRQRGGTR